jgi:uncharacterized protein YpbB
MMFDYILTLFSSGDKRRISTLYQVLTGKRTSSVLLYSFFEQLLPAHQSIPKLKKTDFEKMIQQLAEQQLIKRTENEAVITEKGQNYLQKRKIYQVDFGRYGRTAETSWRLLKFSVQVISNLSIQQKEYVPIETSPFYTMKIKSWLATEDRDTLAERFYEEWHELFQQLPKEQADFLANQLTGRDQIGQLPYQLTAADKDTFEVSLIQAEAVHALLAALETKTDFVLYDLVKDVLRQNLNQSMLVTRQMVLAGETKEMILKKRQLKAGTLADHLIEWALFFSDFPYEKFISEQTILVLEKLKTPIKDWRYQEVSPSGQLDYGEFRLYQIQHLKGERKWND